MNKGKTSSSNSKEKVFARHFCVRNGKINKRLSFLLRVTFISECCSCLPAIYHSRQILSTVLCFTLDFLEISWGLQESGSAKENKK